jgi:hypothetical protein
MDFDQLLLRAFGTTDLSAVPHDNLLAGVETLRGQLGTEGDAGERFAIWCLLYMLGGAPEPEDVFDDEADVEAARDFADSMDEEDE